MVNNMVKWLFGTKIHIGVQPFTFPLSNNVYRYIQCSFTFDNLRNESNIFSVNRGINQKFLDQPKKY